MRPDEPIDEPPQREPEPGVGREDDYYTNTEADAGKYERDHG